VSGRLGERQRAAALVRMQALRRDTQDDGNQTP
jgi:hypothetical protein